MIDVKVQSEQARVKFERLKKNLDDLTPIWTKFENEYREIITQNFGSQGKIMERKKWTEYKKDSSRAMTSRELKKTGEMLGYEAVSGTIRESRYFVWKKKHFPGKPMLELTGDLKKAAIGFKSKITKESMTITVEGADYFFYVQERKTNPRYYFNTPEGDIPLIAWKVLIEIAEKEIVKGVNP